MTPHIGMEFQSKNEAYNFYNLYAHKMGFNIRRSIDHKNKKGDIINRIFCCSKEGKRREDRRDSEVKQPRPITRCGCLAHIKI